MLVDYVDLIAKVLIINALIAEPEQQCSLCGIAYNRTLRVDSSSTVQGDGFGENGQFGCCCDSLKY